MSSILAFLLFRFLSSQEHSYSLCDIIISWFISWLTHWAVELTLPQTVLLQIAWRQGGRVMLHRVRSEPIQLLYFGTLGFVNDACGSWDRLIILYVYIFIIGEPCSSFNSCWHSGYLILGCSNKKCSYQHDTMWSWKLSFLRLDGLIERNSRIHIVMFLHK